jgi:actin-related protein
VESVNACEIDARAHLLDNIVILGGGAKIPFMNDRILYEVKRLLQHQFCVSSCTRPPSQYAKQSSSFGTFQAQIARAIAARNGDNNKSAPSDTWRDDVGGNRRVRVRLFDVNGICDPQLLTWTGGSCLASMSTFQQM